MRALSAALEKNTHLCRIDMSWNGDVEEDTKLDIIHKLIRNLTARGQLQLHKENVALELYLNGLALGCSGVCKVIEMLAKNTVICRFNFADNDIREVGAAAIFEWLNRSATVTTHIDLDENDDMDDQMKEKIAALLVKNRSLPHFSTCFNNICSDPMVLPARNFDSDTGKEAYPAAGGRRSSF